MLTELRTGLLRWTAGHPAWRPGAQPGSPADWPADVGCVACEAEDAFMLIDPLIPGDGREEFLAELDERVRRHARRVAILTTIKFHRRSRDELARRYHATTSRARSSLPAGVETLTIRGAGETMVWLPDHRALVPGDRLIGDGRGGVRLCPESWLGYLSSGMKLVGLREALRPLRELPIESVLVSHGEPVLHGGAQAIALALSD